MIYIFDGLTSSNELQDFTDLPVDILHQDTGRVNIKWLLNKNR